jgi:uncharacterized membrane protein YhdT
LLSIASLQSEAFFIKQKIVAGYFSGEHNENGYTKFGRWFYFVSCISIIIFLPIILPKYLG